MLKSVFVEWKLFPLILAFAVTVHKCQGLLLDCAIMDLSNQMFCAGMAYMALSQVKREVCNIKGAAPVRATLIFYVFEDLPEKTH